MRLNDWENRFASALRSRWMGKTVEWHDSLDSTQTRAKELAVAGTPDGTVVVARSQTAGHGRKGAAWHSPVGGLWASVVLFPKTPASEVAQLTLKGARAIQECLTFDFCVKAEIKLPNDVLIEGKKVAGILADSASRAGQDGVDWLVLGFGLNVSNSFPPDLADVGVALSYHLKPPPAEENVLARVLERLEALY
jgi:BirA family biotin operon repressor/biotin-[acetyl-CoA-carboxylase] ligase